MDLAKKKILVVGAGGLLGLELVQNLLNAGTEVIATDIDKDALCSKLAKSGVGVKHANLFLHRLDITNEAEVKTFFRDQEFLDGAVNCAYPRNAKYGSHFFEVTLASFNDNVALNLGSSFLFTQQCAVHFLKSKKPFSLVNISSIYGVVAPDFKIYENTSMTMPVEYAAIKAALLHLNKYVASYVSNSDFRLNSVSPGGLFDGQPESFLDQYKRQTLGEGMLSSKDILGAIKFLLSDDSKYINGQNIVVDDGFSL